MVNVHLTESELPHKHTATDFEIKITMICKYKSEQSLSAIAFGLGFEVSAANIVKDAARIKEHVKEMAMMKSVIAKIFEGVISEMEKLSTMWMEAQIQKSFPPSLTTIKAEARNMSDNQKIS